MLIVIFGLAWLAVVVRLFTIQVLNGAEYRALASGQRELLRRLLPERGEVFVRDRRTAAGEFPIATNEQTFTIYAVPRDVVEPKRTARLLAPTLGVAEDVLRERLGKRDDPYEPLARRVNRSVRDAVLARDLPGIAADPSLTRYYPDAAPFAHLTGFVGEDERGVSGRYGIEGAFDAALAGSAGVLESERDPRGRWIVFGERRVQPARDGADVLLTVEREVQLDACRRLEAAVAAHGAAGGTVVILAPATGAVRALCAVPSYDPNRYREVTDVGVFRAPAVVGAYEPGSVFKPITVAAAIDAGAVEPTTRFVDQGSVTVGGRTITNTDGRVYGERTVTDVLRFSINTGAVFVARELGIDRFRAAVERFGFGVRTDVELEGESPGDTRNLAAGGLLALATGSYGQGVTVTPLQLAAAYAAIANGGRLMHPYVVAEVRQPDGVRRRTEPRLIRQVVSARTAALLQGMLVSVVRDGYPKRAGVPGYRIGGKTGTAQIPLPDRPGYSDETIHTFAGFGPADRPTFAMVVRIDRPKSRPFADSTAAPLFGEIAKFILEYDGIPPRTE